MRRHTTAWAIFVFAVVMGFVGWRIYAASEFTRLNSVKHVVAAPSEKYIKLLIRYANPPFVEEEYDMQDVNGVSNYSYRVRGFNGKQITVQPKSDELKTTTVSFFYENLDHLIGVWQMQSKPPKGDTSIAYTLYVKDVDDYKQGDRRVTFTDPNYWATKAGHEYHLDLSHMNTKDPNALLKMQSTSLADDRYQRLVDAFRGFGPKVFRDNIATAQRTVRAAGT